MREMCCLVLAMAMMAGGCATSAPVYRAPSYDCVYVKNRIQIDGRLDDPEWREAAPISLVSTDTGRAPTKLTVARMLWTDAFLYVGFECEDEDIQAKMRHADDDLWLEEEVVEVFFSPGENLLEYLEFEVNPLNARIDLHCVASSPDGDVKVCDKEWNCTGWFSAVAVDGTLNDADDKDQGWSCEIAFPFASVCPGRRIRLGDAWRLNLYRINKVSEGVEYSAWSPTGAINFHVPGKFGECRFVEAGDVAAGSVGDGGSAADGKSLGQ